MSERGFKKIQARFDDVVAKRKSRDEYSVTDEEIYLNLLDGSKLAENARVLKVSVPRLVEFIRHRYPHEFATPEARHGWAKIAAEYRGKKVKK